MFKRLLSVVIVLFLGCEFVEGFLSEASLSFSSNEYYNSSDITFSYDYSEGPNTTAQVDLYQWDQTIGTYSFVISFDLDPGQAQTLAINFATLGIGLGEGKYRVVASLSQFRGSQKAVLPGGISTHDFIYDETPPPAPNISGLGWDATNFNHIWTYISMDMTTFDNEAPVYLYYTNGDSGAPDFTDDTLFDTLPTTSPGIFPTDPTEDLETWDLYVVARDAAGNTTVASPTNVDFTTSLIPSITAITPNTSVTLVSRADREFNIDGSNFLQGARVWIADNGDVDYVGFVTWKSDTELGIYIDITNASVGAATLNVENPGSITDDFAISITL